jgi:hypothetical protein
VSGSIVRIPLGKVRKILCQRNTKAFVSAAPISGIPVRSASTANLYRASGGLVTPCLPSRLSWVRIPSTGYWDYPLEGEVGQGACLHSQLLPSWFPPFFDASRLDPTLPSPAGKHTADSCRLSTKRMVHLSRDAGTHVVPGKGSPPCFCLERWRMACANPQVVLLAAFSRLLSRCYPLLYRPPVLRLLCADETSSAPWTSCVLPCTCSQYAGKMQGKVDVQVATTHMCNLSCCQDVIVPLS